LRPATRLKQWQLDKLGQAAGTWTLVDSLPRDAHDAFADLSEEELAALIPESSRAEYARDGQPAAPDDPEERIVDGNYSRVLRDYATSFHHYARQTTLLSDQIAGATADLESLTQVIADAAQQTTAREQELAFLSESLEYARHELTSVTELESQVQDELTLVQGEIVRVLGENRQLAADWASRSQGAAAAGVRPAVATNDPLK
jgi:hypothetical protein